MLGIGRVAAACGEIDWSERGRPPGVWQARQRMEDKKKGGRPKAAPS